jgi:cyclopropane-fatty-acyl-phospholipid synthase
MEHVLCRSFDRSIRRGSLRIEFASGRVREFGDGSEQAIAIRFTDSAAVRAVALDPALALAEMYIEGRLVVEQGSIYDLLSLIMRNGARKLASWSSTAFYAQRLLASYGRERLTPEVSKRNVAHHYDLDESLFRLFLDSDMQYSCAYFESPDQSLEGAQLAKKRHIASKMLVEPEHSVLDIGSGWGGMALYLAEVAGAEVTGVTLSDEQLRVSRQRATKRGLSERARFELSDYRDIHRTFDRIVSIGMFEHVGWRNYDAFFETTARLLERRGVFVLHSIGRTKRRRAPQPFLDKYIFPGSYIPALSEVIPYAERAGFLVKDVEVLPLHYAQTLREWRRRFLDQRERVLDLYDERFVRMWEFYLAVSETAFRHDRMFVFQLQLARHQDAVPTRRDYQAERKQVLQLAESRVEAYASI